VHPHGGEKERCEGKEETALSHVPLVELCGGADEKQELGFNERLQ
jgi:hypothetical protein